MKYYIIAGEASGDLHSANLMREIKRLDGSSTFRIWGGEKMEAQGGELVKHYRELAFMGFYEVIANLGAIFKNIRFCKDDILNFRPDVLILVDYPGFNLRIAQFAHSRGIKVFYYISPQVWAWKKSRVKKIKKYVDRMYVILPFEKSFYAKYEIDVDFVGHPLLDAIENEKQKFSAGEVFRQRNQLDDRPVIAILPGSRKQEIAKILPVMLSVQSKFPAHQFLIAGASAIEESFYAQFDPASSTKIVYNQTLDLLNNSFAALVTSGTATLETALMNVPQVVCYKGNWLSYQIAKRIVDVKFISLVNLIMQKEVVKELIQNDLNQFALERELGLLFEPGNRQRVISEYSELKHKLGGKGASALAAKLMFERLKETVKL